MTYLTAEEASKKFNISKRRIQILCRTGRIKGAKINGHTWLIPANATKPKDERFNEIPEGFISINELCKELSISLATGKNWVKLGKIIPYSDTNGLLLFKKDYPAELKKELKKEDSSALKKRRNKQFVTGNNFYNNYVSNDSENVKIIQNFIEFLRKNNIKITDNIICKSLAECAKQIITNKKNNLKNYEYLIKELSKNHNSDEIDFSKFQYKYIPNEDTLGLLYISLKNTGERKQSGAYYTPINVVKGLCATLNNLENKTICDPCCGSGNFLLNLPDNIPAENIYGNDIDTVSVKLARLNIAIKYGITDKDFLFSHITNENFLEKKDNKKYDIIIGNPPWGANFTDDEQKLYKKLFSSATGQHIESYDIITEQGINCLKKNGVLAFVLPEAFLNVKSHSKIREFIAKNNSVKYIQYLGNAFDGVNCPSIILQIIHNNKPFSTKGMVIQTKNRSFRINTEREINGNYFNFLTDDKEYNILKKIENIPNKITLKNNSKFALGIVTGDNKKYLSDKKNKNNEMVLKGVNINKFNYENSNTYITYTPEKFQQVAPTELYRAKEKLFYKFISSELVFAYDNKQTLSLNSCNILIPEIEGLDIKYILAILNSSVAQFYIKSKYNSLKILREHIENIPIPYVDKKTHDIIIKEVDNILNSKDFKDKFYNLDEIIASLYELNKGEYLKIKNM